MQGPVHFIGLETVLGGDRALIPMEVGVCVFFFFSKKLLFTNQDPSFAWKGYFYDNISLLLAHSPYEIYESFSVCFFLGRTEELHKKQQSTVRLIEWITGKRINAHCGPSSFTLFIFFFLCDVLSNSC